LGCSVFARRYSRNRGCFLFLGVLRWFTSPRSLPQSYVFTLGWQGMTPAGFPHSEIPGSKLICSSPRLIAACHVLHRLSAPRHPPCTLSSLTKLECILDSTNLSSMSDSVVKEPDGAARLRPERSRVRPESTTPAPASKQRAPERLSRSQLVDPRPPKPDRRV
jgi:hypothetical protein